MSKKSIFKCKECGYESPKWLGKCPDCESWNSFVEVAPKSEKEVDKHNISGESGLVVESLDQVLGKLKNSKEKRIYKYSSELLNNFWGGGLVAGGLTLLAGEPGLGKSTLALQVLKSLWNGQKEVQHDKNLKLLYITAEESVFELARRSERLGIPKEILVLQSNNFEQIEKILNEEKPQVVIVDSVQTIFSSNLDSNPGSVRQVSTLASQLLAISKSKNISVVIVGHVTKDGQIAGPKTLEHLVDSVLLLESAKNQNYRTLSFSKHRFGNTSGLLLLKMEETGLEIVTDPSLALLENLETGVGVVYAMAMDKDLSLVVEVQALVSNSNLEGEGKSFGRREALGFKTSKLNTILAIIEKYLGLNLKSYDIYVQLTGLPKNTYDESLDLPIFLAILSSLKGVSIDEILKITKKSKPVFAGRLTLSGRLRNATNHKQREETAKKLKFDYNPKIEVGEIEKIV